jgi:hypothetical protein
MNNDGRSERLTEEELLTLSIQKAGHFDEPKFVRPSAQCVANCVLGQATAEERTIMTKALLGSSAFRREMLQLLRDKALAEGETFGLDDSAMQATEVPEYLAFLRSMNAEPSGPVLRRTWLMPLAATLVLAASVLLLLKGTEQPDQTMSSSQVTWRIDTEDLDPALLISDNMRAVSPTDSVNVHSDARQAALNAFHGILEVDSTGLSINLALPQTKPPAEGKELLTLLAPDGNIRATLRIPPEHEAVPGDLQAWAITLPSRHLYVLDVDSLPAVAPWPDATDSVSCVALILNRNGSSSVVYSTLLIK